MISIGLIDDDFRTLNNLKRLFNYSDKIEVSLIANSGQEFLELLNTMKSDSHPSIVLVDIDMPDLSGIDTVLIAKAKYPHINFIMLTVFDDEEKLFLAIKAGACGYLLKDEKISVIIDHIESAYTHNVVALSPSIALKTLALLKKSEIPGQQSQGVDFQLSDRELEVLQFIVNGLNYIEIGTQLHISKNTVKKHISNIYRKLHVSSKAEAIRLVHFHRIL